MNKNTYYTLLHIPSGKYNIECFSKKKFVLSLMEAFNKDNNYNIIINNDCFCFYAYKDAGTIKSSKEEFEIIEISEQTVETWPKNHLIKSDIYKSKIKT